MTRAARRIRAGLGIGLWMAILALASPVAAQEQSPPEASPWRLLDDVRRDLAAAGAVAADFVQDYVPAGFTSGEREAGRLALRLPDCLRWDYESPYPKSYLLCGDRFYGWNPEDGTGQRATVEGREEPGLDLLLLPVAELRERYRATARGVEGGEELLEILLEPPVEGGPLADARLLLDRRALRLLELAYRDREGNETRFRISGYRPLGATDAFEPPRGITWRD